jgi:ClpP class serine protease
MSVVAYPNIIKAIKKADNAEHIDITLFRVDTPGGHVDGADEAEQAISSAKNKTVTLFENTGASGGLWIFPAADEVYATESTMLGSVGVVASYRNPSSEKDSGIIELTSTNAPNKRCTLGADCKEKMQTMLDGYEAMFFSRLEKNTGFNAEKIKSTFDNGGMIFADKAKKAGFIKDITTFDSLLSTLISSGVNHSSVTASAQIKNSSEGHSMEYTKEAFEALENKHAEAVKMLEQDKVLLQSSMDSTVAKLKLEIEDMQTKIEAKAKILPEVMSMAYARGVDKDTLIAMAKADTLESAKIACFDSMGSNGAFGADKNSFSADDKTDSKAELNTRVKKLGVTFIGGE